MPTPGFLELLVIVVVGLMIVGPIVLVGWIVLSRGRPARDPALDALRQRFAEGDIDEAEFERLRSVLQRH